MLGPFPKANYAGRMIIVTSKLLVLIVLAGAFQREANASRRWFPHRWIPFVATAYSTPGETASQSMTKAGRTVAADPTVLPIGTVIEIKNAGPYSGQYVVQDTGDMIVGRRIDIFVPNHAAAVEFGRKSVRVRVVKKAPETAKARREAAAEATIAPKPPTPAGAGSVH
jgi:3D (Asp-Asp-Asp) domain-containing protein